MEIRRKKIIEDYMTDPSFLRFYFRDQFFEGNDQILNVNYEGKYFQFSVERLTVRHFDEISYRKYKDRKVFNNQSYRVVLYLEGSTAVYVGNEKRTCDNTTLLFLSPGPQISATPKIPSTCTILEFYFDLISEDYSYLEIPFTHYLSLLTGIDLKESEDFLTIPGILQDELRVKFDNLSYLLRRSEVSSGLSLQLSEKVGEAKTNHFQSNRAVLEIFSFFIENILSVQGEPLKEDDQLDPVVRAMTENYATQYSMSDLAEIACLSKHYFQSVFKKKYAMTPGDFLNRIRIRQAMLLIEKSSLSSKQISSSVGFMDPAYFSKVFKKYIGVSPSVFRNRLNT